MSRTVLITGATGLVSGVLINDLKDSGFKLRALVRNPAKAGALAAAGVEVFEGDLERPRTLGPAFDGADAVWIWSPPGPRAPDQSSNAVWAARKGGATHVVRMSAFGADFTAPNLNSRMHALSDAELAGSGLTYTILKPHFFMQNLLMAAQSVATQGAMYWALKDGRLAMIDARDIGSAAAKVLTTPGHENKTYTLTGPRSITIHQVAEALTAALGKPVTYVPIPLEASEAALVGFGLDEWNRVALWDYFTSYGNNWGDHVTDDLPKLLGRAPLDITDFARDFAPAFGKAG